MRKLLALAVLLAPRFALGQGLADADVLPQGVGGLLLQPGMSYGPGSLQRFGRGWRINRESFIADFNGLDLSEVIAGDNAGALTEIYGKLGTTGFEGAQQSFALNLIAAFGLTDRLTLIAAMPYATTTYTLDAYLVPDLDEAKRSRFGVENEQLIRCDGGDFDIAQDIGRILVPKTEPSPRDVFNIEDLNRALKSPCLGYNGVIDRSELRNGVVHGYADRTYSGFRDLAIGAKYQFWHGRNFNLAGLGYVILPTGKPDSPDDLFDLGFGDGQTDAALLAAITVPLGDFRIGASGGYEISFGDSIERRLSGLTFDDATETALAKGEITEEEVLTNRLDDGTLIPLVTAADKAEVTRKLGNNIYVYSQFGYQILEWLSVGVTLNFLHHFRDEVSEIGPRNLGAAPYPNEQEVRAQVDADIAAREAVGAFANEPDPVAAREAARINGLKAGLSNTVARRKAAYGWHTVRGNLVGGFGVNFNTLGMFLRDEFPLPIIASVSISRNLAGQNLDTPDTLQMTLVIPFAVTSDILDPSTVAFDGEDGVGLPYP